MRRYLVLAALSFSAAVHALLVPEHLREVPLLGLLFVAGAILEAAILVALAVRPSRAAVAAAALTLVGMLAAYVPFVVLRLPGFPMTPEPLERVALLTKAAEVVGAAAAVTLWTHPSRLSRRLAPAAATIAISCLAAGVAAPPSLADAGGVERAVDIPGMAFSPDALPVLVGDTVTWTNHDGQTHTVTADDDAFDSGRLEPGARFSFTFTKPGVYRYHCEIHRFMHGEIHVYAVALIGPARSVPLGATVTLNGLVPRGVDVVGLEQHQADGSYAAAASAVPAADGSYSFRVVVSGPARYRVRAGDQLSGQVAVRPRPRVTLRARRVGARASISVGAAPDQAGAPVAVERYVRERYLWLPVRTRALDHDGHAAFSVPARAHGARFRAHLLHGRNGWGDATSVAATLP